MLVQLNNGSKVLMDYDHDRAGFTFEDMHITNPFVSECSRFSEDPSHYGFKEDTASDGHTRLVLDLGEGDTVWLTDRTGASIPDLQDIEGNVMTIIRQTEVGTLTILVTMAEVLNHGSGQ
ncbi:hypothetical protein ACYPKM_01970 [Pseudomonas aeruginosa]